MKGDFRLHPPFVRGNMMRANESSLQPKGVAMRLVAALLVFAVNSSTVFAQDKTWVGKTVILKEGGIKIFLMGDDGKYVNVGELRGIDYRVLADQGGLLKVNDGRGNGGWFNKADAVQSEDAVGYFTERIRQELNDARSYFCRGVAWDIKGKFDFAINDFTEVLRLNPGSGAYTARGNAWGEKKDYDKAIADYNEAIRLNPKNANIYYNRGNAWRGKKQYGKAIADYDEARRLDPKDGSAIANTAWILGRVDIASVKLGYPGSV